MYSFFLDRAQWLASDPGTWIGLMNLFGYEMGVRIIYLDFNAQIYNI